MKSPHGDFPPPLAHYNRQLAGRGIVSGGGHPLCFVAQTERLDYERHIFATGEVPTRPNNWHDAYNAEVWLEFPLAKAALNRRHVEAQADGNLKRGPGRGRVRDRLTQFDECGVIVAGIGDAAWDALCNHRWREVFVTRRAELLATTRFLIFGHASREALHAPFIGLCGKAWRVRAAGDTVAEVDLELSRRLASAEFCIPLPALPLLGIPGITADNEEPAYYDDVRQFCPPRTITAGSSPDSR